MKNRNRLIKMNQKKSQNLQLLRNFSVKSLLRSEVKYDNQMQMQENNLNSVRYIIKNIFHLEDCLWGNLQGKLLPKLNNFNYFPATKFPWNTGDFILRSKESQLWKWKLVENFPTTLQCLLAGKFSWEKLETKGRLYAWI